jgi:hypothetical protein
MKNLREGERWRNSRSGRVAVVKMVRGGRVQYRYERADALRRRTYALHMTQKEFLEAFEET